MLLFPWHDIMMLGIESSSVIQKRLTRIALGGTGSAEEIRLMVFEKSDAACQSAVALLFGCSPLTLIDQLRVRVASNEARLSA